MQSALTLNVKCMIYQHILARATLEKEEVMETTGTDL